MDVNNINAEKNSQSTESKLDDVSKLNSLESETIGIIEKESQNVESLSKSNKPEIRFAQNSTETKMDVNDSVPATIEFILQDKEVANEEAKRKENILNEPAVTTTASTQSEKNDLTIVPVEGENNDPSADLMGSRETQSSSTNDILSENYDQSMDQTDQDIHQENPVLDNEIQEGQISNSKGNMQKETGDEDLEVIFVIDEDPLENFHAGEGEKNEQIYFTVDTNEKYQLKIIDFNAVETITSDKSSIDKRLCNIPDTENFILQEENDAAAAAKAPRANDVLSALEISVVSATQLNTDASIGTEELNNIATDKIQREATEGTSKISVVNHAQMKSTTSFINEFQITEITSDNITEKFCHQCCVVRKCSHKVDIDGKTEYFCGFACATSFKTRNKQQNVQNKSNQLKLKDIVKKMPNSMSDDIPMFMRKCADCLQIIISIKDKTLSWQAMDFCNENCLAKYQNKICSHCANCKKIVEMRNLGKYCVRFVHGIRQFCYRGCLEKFKKVLLQVCGYCQKDISIGSGNFSSLVGDKGQYKFFCTQFCMEKFQQIGNKNTNDKISTTVDISHCFICNNEKQILIKFEQMDKKYKFCSESCFYVFKFVNNTNPPQCDMCKDYYDNEQSVEFLNYYNNGMMHFCSKTCQNIYIIENRRMVSCIWCKIKKYNFDMIKKFCNNGQALMMCSLYCLNLFQVSLKKIKCDYCSKSLQAQYHLIMSDATIKNFCTNNCVLLFKNQFSNLSITLNTGEKPVVPNVVSAGGSKSYQNRLTHSIGNNTVNEVRTPVMSNVQSLANAATNTITQSSAAHVNIQQSSPQPSMSPKLQILQQIIVQAPPLPPMKNAATMCKPYLHDKAVSCRPYLYSKETQTDEIKERRIFVPVPVPFYVPSPMHMYSAPVPVPIPFLLPIPVPVFIPITRHSAIGITKEMKKIQDKTPSDSFENEPHMLADMITGEKNVDNVNSEIEEDDMVNTVGFKGFNRGQRRSTPVEFSLYSPLQPASASPPKPIEQSNANMCLEYRFGVNAWKQWVNAKNAELERCKFFKIEILQLTADELNYSLCLFLQEVRKPNKTEYDPDTIYYVCLGIQQYLFENGRIDNIFTDASYEKFTDCLDKIVEKFFVLYNDSLYIATCVEEEHLWESKQLGAHSPHVLLSTLMFFNTKHFNLTTVDEHMQLSFYHIIKHWNEDSAAKALGTRNESLRFYPPQTTLDANSRKKKVYEQQVNNENPLRCPVNFYEFYLSKCPDIVKTRNDVFYLVPEDSCVPDSSLWYSIRPLGRKALEKMLNRMKIVKEINVALLNS